MPQAFDAADVPPIPRCVRRPIGRTRDAGIDAFCLSFDRPLPWPDVMARLERLILAHGNALLRMKAILHLQDHDQPLAIHSIGTCCIRPSRWPHGRHGDPRISHLVFVTRDLARSGRGGAAAMRRGFVAVDGQGRAAGAFSA